MTRPEESRSTGPESFAVARLEALKRATTHSLSTAAGILVGPLYIVGVFLALGAVTPTALGTFSFLVGAPAALSILVAVITKAAFARALGTTLAAILAAVTVLYVTGLESGLCLVVLMLPLVVFSALVSIALNLSRLARIRVDLARFKTLTALILMAPLGGAMLEDRYLAVTTTQTVASAVAIKADPATIWHGVVEVSPFSERELPPTWLQHLGVPRPVYATVQLVNGKSTRLGHFEDALTFTESIETLLPGRELSLSIRSVDYSGNPRSVIAHALSQGFARIEVVQYRISPQSNGATLTLSCSYSVRTTVVPYATLVGDTVIKSFQRELLNALAARFERRAPQGGVRLVAQLE